MNSRQIEVINHEAKSEEEILKELLKIYEQARQDCSDRIRQLSMRTDLQNIQSIVYQKQYQEAIAKQIDEIINDLHSNEYESIDDYLKQCYEDAWIGNMYDLAGQGIPMILPINQEQLTRAVQLDSRISEGLYKRLGNDVQTLKKDITQTVSRGILSGRTWVDVAEDLSHKITDPFGGSLFRAMRIVRTEGHRIQQESRYLAQQEAKAHGADIVKQWDATLDDRTRISHILLDGQIREVDEPFHSEVTGREAMYPGDFGEPSEDINCRCQSIQRAKWALDEEELETLQERAEYFGLDNTENFDEFKEKYLGIEINHDEESASRNHIGWEEKIQNSNYVDPNTRDQFSRYQEVLGDMFPCETPKDLRNLKRDDPDKWKKLQYKYRVVNQYQQETDHQMSPQKIYDLHNTAYHTKRNQFSSKDNKYGGNIGVIEFNDKMLFAHSAATKTTDSAYVNYIGNKDQVVLIKDDEVRHFKTLFVNSKNEIDGEGAWDRKVDSEAKLLEKVHELIENGVAISEIDLLSEKTCCPSCKKMIIRFQEEHPDVILRVVSTKADRFEIVKAEKDKDKKGFIDLWKRK